MSNTYVNQIIIRHYALDKHSIQLLSDVRHLTYYVCVSRQGQSCPKRGAGN